MLLADAEQVPKVVGWVRAAGARLVVFHDEDEDEDEDDDEDEGEVEGDPAHAARPELPPGAERYADLPEPDPYAAPPEVEIRPEDDATIIYTSGTTGRPKGAVATHLAQAGAALNPRYQAAVSALCRGVVPGQGPASVTLMTFPFFHVAAFTGLYAAMAAGGALVLMPKWDAGEALRLIRLRQGHPLRGRPRDRAPAARGGGQRGRRPGEPEGAEHRWGGGLSRPGRAAHGPVRRAHRAAQRLRPDRDQRRGTGRFRRGVPGAPRLRGRPDAGHRGTDRRTGRRGAPGRRGGRAVAAWPVPGPWLLA